MNIVLAISGGIAAYKTVELLRLLQKSGHQVGVVMTNAAKEFVSPYTLKILCDGKFLDDVFEADAAGISHIDIADWADIIAVVPASAHTLAKLAHGMADDPVSLVFLASRAKKIIFPAMNVNMWNNEATQANIKILRQRSIAVIEPAEGVLACGWHGAGRLPQYQEMVNHISQLGMTSQEFAGKNIVITAGPTREYIDPTRFISNPSSGKMGFCLAEAVARRGANVQLIAGPTHLTVKHQQIALTPVVSAQEMYHATAEAFERAPVDIFIAAAAVADYRTDVTLDHKHKKQTEDITIKLVPNPDILKEIVAKYQPKVAIGFAAETHDVLDYARKKLVAKNLTMIVANQVHYDQKGFAAEENHVWLIDKHDHIVELPLAPKDEIAEQIIDQIKQYLN